MRHALIILFLFLSLAAYSEPLRFGIASIISPEESLVLYHDFNDYIASKLGRHVETVIKRDYDVMNQMIKNSSVDIASICTGAVAYLDDAEVKIVAVPEVNGKHSYQSFIIANKNSGVRRIDDLKGISFAFTDRLSNSGTIYPSFLVIKHFSRSPEEIFKNIYYTKSHDKSIYLVNKGVIDAAAVDSLIFEYIRKSRPAEVSNINIVHESPSIISPPIVASATLPHSTFLKIQQILLNMHKTNEGMEILRHLNIDRFVKSDMKDFDIIREIKRSVETFNTENNTKQLQ